MLTKFVLEIVITFVTVVNLENVITLSVVHDIFLDDTVIINIMKTQDHSKNKDMKSSSDNEFTIFKKVIIDDEFKQ